jgi:hypothetical protein
MMYYIWFFSFHSSVSFSHLTTWKIHIIQLTNQQNKNNQPNSTTRYDQRSLPQRLQRTKVEGSLKNKNVEHGKKQDRILDDTNQASNRRWLDYWWHTCHINFLGHLNKYFSLKHGSLNLPDKCLGMLNAVMKCIFHPNFMWHWPAINFFYKCIDELLEWVGLTLNISINVGNNGTTANLLEWLYIWRQSTLSKEYSIQ